MVPVVEEPQRLYALRDLFVAVLTSVVYFSVADSPCEVRMNVDLLDSSFVWNALHHPGLRTFVEHD